MSYIPIIMFILGAACGAGLVILGAYLGFKVSYDIRNHKAGVLDTDGLLSPSEDLGEIDMLGIDPKDDDD